MTILFELFTMTSCMYDVRKISIEYAAVKVTSVRRVDGPCIRPCTYTARVNVHLCVRWNMQLATIRRSTTCAKSVLCTMPTKKHV